LKVCYINLDSAAERRAALERNFAACNAHGWTLTRFAAVDKGSLPPEAARLDGLGPGERACFLSHLAAIEAHGDGSDDLMLVEDDALFGKGSQRAILRAIDMLPRDRWDVLLTDICITDVEDMLNLFRRKRRRPADMQLMNLTKIAFAGSTAYVLNKDRIAATRRTLADPGAEALPYDLHVRRLVRAGSLAAWVIFPFVTSLSAWSDASQVQREATQGTELLWNAFRKLIWIEPEHAEVQRCLDLIPPDLFDDREATLASRILQGMLSGKRVSK